MVHKKSLFLNPSTFFNLSTRKIYTVDIFIIIKKKVSKLN